MMDVRKIQKLIQLLEGSDVAEIEIKEGEDSVRISRLNSGMMTNAAQTDPNEVRDLLSWRMAVNVLLVTLPDLFFQLLNTRGRFRLKHAAGRQQAEKSGRAGQLFARKAQGDAFAAGLADVVQGADGGQVQKGDILHALRV